MHLAMLLFPQLPLVPCRLYTAVLVPWSDARRTTHGTRTARGCFALEFFVCQRVVLSERQAELFAVAAAVSGKDYWCLLSDSTSSDSGPSDAHASNAARPRHRGGSITTGNNRGGGDGDEVLQRQWEGQDAAPDAVPVRVPPSLRAVVIAVLFANRLAASAREASAARATFAADGGRGGGGGREAVAEARLERHEMRRHRQRQQVGGGGQTDSRYLVSETSSRPHGKKRKE